MKLFVRILFTGLVMASLSSCASLSHKKDDQALSQVRKVAVVAFTADEPASATLGFSLTSHKAKAEAGGSLISQKSESVDQMLQELQDSFANNMHWSVVDTEAMTQNSGYTSAFKRTMEGWQNKMPPGAGQNRFIVDHVMDFDCVRILDRSGRDQLIDALGVDAIVAAQVKVIMNGTSVMGIGSRHPQSNLSFMMYVKGQDAPVWFEGQIQGKEAEKSVGVTGYTDEAATARLSLESAKTAFAKIGQTNE